MAAKKAAKIKKAVPAVKKSAGLPAQPAKSDGRGKPARVSAPPPAVPARLQAKSRRVSQPIRTTGQAVVAAVRKRLPQAARPAAIRTEPGSSPLSAPPAIQTPAVEATSSTDAQSPAETPSVWVQPGPAPELTSWDEALLQELESLPAAGPLPVEPAADPAVDSPAETGPQAQAVAGPDLDKEALTAGLAETTRESGKEAEGWSEAGLELELESELDTELRRETEAEFEPGDIPGRPAVFAPKDPTFSGESKPTVASVPEPIFEAVPEPAAEPVPATAAGPAPEFLAESAPEPAAASVPESITEPVPPQVSASEIFSPAKQNPAAMHSEPESAGQVEPATLADSEISEPAAEAAGIGSQPAVAAAAARKSEAEPADLQPGNQAADDLGVLIFSAVMEATDRMARDQAAEDGRRQPLASASPEVSAPAYQAGRGDAQRETARQHQPEAESEAAFPSASITAPETADQAIPQPMVGGEEIMTASIRHLSGAPDQPFSASPAAAVPPRASRRKQSVLGLWRDASQRKALLIGFLAGLGLSALLGAWGVRTYSQLWQENQKLKMQVAEETRTLKTQLENAQIENEQFRTGNKRLSELMSSFGSTWNQPPERPRYMRAGQGLIVYWEEELLWRRYFLSYGQGNRGPLVRNGKYALKRNFAYFPNLTPGVWRFSVTALNKEGRETAPSEPLVLRLPLLQ